MSRLRHLLALIAVVSVSGIHLVFMQGGAWALMLWDRDQAGDTEPLAQQMGELFTAAKPCERCLITMRAGMDAHQDSQDQRPVPPDMTELRLIPTHLQPLRLTPPAPVHCPVPPSVLGMPGLADPAPLSPPPRVGSRTPLV